MSTERRRLRLLGVLLAVVVVLAVFARVNATLEPVVRAGDKEAALAADQIVLKVSDAIADADPADRPQAAESWLLEQEDERLLPQTEWVVGGRDGSRVPVTFYVWWEDRSFSGSFWGNGSYWGRSCQVFTVTAERVTSEPVGCAADSDRPAGK